MDPRNSAGPVRDRMVRCAVSHGLLPAVWRLWNDGLWLAHADAQRFWLWRTHDGRLWFVLRPDSIGCVGPDRAGDHLAVQCHQESERSKIIVHSESRY